MQDGTTRRSLATACLLGVLAAACGGGEPVVAPTPTSAPTVAPTPTAPQPVAMTHRVEAIQVAANDVLSKDSGITPSRRTMDETSLAAVAESLIELLRTHLDDLNGGGSGTLAAIGAQLFTVDPAMTALATTDLASPDNVATAVDLLLRVGVDGVPRWAQADLVVTRQDGTVIDLDLVFATDGDLTLVVLGGEEVA